MLKHAMENWLPDLPMKTLESVTVTDYGPAV